MKKITAILLSLLMILGVSVMVTSCDDPSKSEVDTSYLIGSWENTQSAYGMTVSVVYTFTNTTITTESFMGDAVMQGLKGTYTGNANGITVNYTQQYDAYTDSYTDCSISGNVQITKISNTQISIDGTTYTKK